MATLTNSVMTYSKILKIELVFQDCFLKEIIAIIRQMLSLVSRLYEDETPSFLLSVVRLTLRPTVSPKNKILAAIPFRVFGVKFLFSCYLTFWHGMELKMQSLDGVFSIADRWIYEISGTIL